MKLSLLIAALLVAIQSGPGRLQGVVVDAQTQAPLPGVTVSLTPAGRRAVTVQTDPSGAFVFDGLTPGRYEYSARKEGYAFGGPARSAENKDLGSWINVEPAESLTNFRIPMTRAAVISGRVVDSRGRPAEGVRAVVMKYRYDDDGKRALAGIGVRAAESDDEGRFRIFGLNSGEYFILFSAPLFTGPVSNEVFVPTYYPGTTDSLNMKSVVVEAGGEIRLSDVVLASEPAVPVTLRIASPVAWSAPDVRTVEFRRPGERGTTMLSGADAFGGPNAVTLGAVSAGTYEVVVGWETGKTNYRAATLIEVGPNGVKGQPVLSLSSGGPLRGSILAQATDGSTRPLAGVEFVLRFGMSQATAASGKDGAFLLPSVPSGENTVRLARLPDDAFVISARQGNRDVLREGVVQSSPDAVEVVIGTAGGAVKGVVQASKGEPVASAIVALVPSDERLRNQQHLYRSANTDQRGMFALRGIAPGSYKLFSWPQLDGAAYRNSEFMKKFEDVGTAVEIRASSESSVELHVIDGAQR